MTRRMSIPSALQELSPTEKRCFIVVFDDSLSTANPNARLAYMSEGCFGRGVGRDLHLKHHSSAHPVS